MNGNGARVLVAAAVLLAASVAFAFDTIELRDPKGDDKGPGTYTYPTHAVYARGSFDLLGVIIEDAGEDVRITIELRARIEDPWDSPSWSGKGWSLQMVQIYVDTDHQPRSGFETALPGMNVRFQDAGWWEKVIVVSPQPDSKIQQEIAAKAGALASGVVLPRSVGVRGKKLVALVRKADLGLTGEAPAGWGWQVLVQSNEGYPKGSDVLSRKVNEMAGEHRFGGGNDYDCDPHVMDILVDPAIGGDDEAEVQYRAMAYRCDEANPESTEGQARLPMLYR